MIADQQGIGTTHGRSGGAGSDAANELVSGDRRAWTNWVDASGFGGFLALGVTRGWQEVSQRESRKHGNTHPGVDPLWPQRRTDNALMGDPNPANPDQR